jgi:uncharacterized membrane protein YhaH (DUF805 family)
MSVSPLKLFFGFNGRIGRKDYWIGIAAVCIGAPVMMAILGLALFGSLLSTGDDFDKGHAIVAFIGAILIYAAFVGLGGISILAITAKRLHDIGQSGFWCLLLTLMPSPLAVLSFHGAMGITGVDPPLVSPAYMTMFMGFLLTIAMIVLGCLEGQDDANKWGDPPEGTPTPPITPDRIAAAVAPANGSGASFGRKAAH